MRKTLNRWRLRRIGFALLFALLATGLGSATWAVLQREDAEEANKGSPPASALLSTKAATPRPLSLQEVLRHPDVIPSHHHPLLGRAAPDIELSDYEGKSWKLPERRADGPVVLVFYYGYHCAGCVRQLRELDRELALFREVGAQVAAISADPLPVTQLRLRQFGALGFPVLSDPGNRVARAYRVFKAELLRHGTCIIDRQGTMQWINVGDAPFRCNTALLYQLARIEGRLPPVP